MDQREKNSNQLNLIRQDNYHCTACPSRKKCKQVTVGFGSLTPQVMIIGDQPTTNDTLCGQPFSGRHRDLLNIFLEEANLHISQVYSTYILKCPGLTKQNLNNCTKWLDKEIATIQPKVYILMGRISANYLLNRPINSNIGEIVYQWFNNKLVVYNTTYLLNNYQEIEKTKIIFKTISNKLEKS